MGNKMYWYLGLVLIIVLLGGYFLMKGQSGYSQPSTDAAIPTVNQDLSTNPDLTNVPTVNISTVNASPSVTFTDEGFVPNAITVKIGTAVTWTNNSSNPMWVASAPHPQHTDLPGFDELKGATTGGTYTYTFQKVGTWKYHNHLNPKFFGQVTVE